VLIVIVCWGALRCFLLQILSPTPLTHLWKVRYPASVTFRMDFQTCSIYNTLNETHRFINSTLLMPLMMIRRSEIYSTKIKLASQPSHLGTMLAPRHLPKCRRQVCVRGPARIEVLRHFEREFLSDLLANLHVRANTAENCSSGQVFKEFTSASAQVKCVGNRSLILYTTELNYDFIGYQHDIESSSRGITASYNLNNDTELNNNEFSKGDHEARQGVSSIFNRSVSFSGNSFESSAGQDSISDASFSSSPFSTEVLPPPGRRGPLSSSARADAKAVKNVKACWRCKILRKKARAPLKSPTKRSY
jgi:hypothetical protein